jgi:hypothetical protein
MISPIRLWLIDDDARTQSGDLWEWASGRSKAHAMPEGVKTPWRTHMPFEFCLVYGASQATLQRAAGIDWLMASQRQEQNHLRGDDGFGSEVRAGEVPLAGHEDHSMDCSRHHETDLGNELRPLAVNNVSAFFTLFILRDKRFLRNHLTIKKALLDGKASGFFTETAREALRRKQLEKDTSFAEITMHQCVRNGMGRGLACYDCHEIVGAEYANECIINCLIIESHENENRPFDSRCSPRGGFLHSSSIYSG